MRAFIVLLVFVPTFFHLVSSNPKNSDPSPLSQDPFPNEDIVPLFAIFQIMDDISNEIFRSFEGSGPGFLSHNHSPNKQKSKNVKKTIFKNGDTIIHKVIIKTYEDGEETEEIIESSENKSEPDYEKAHVTFIENNDNDKDEERKNPEKIKNTNITKENDIKKEEINNIENNDEETSKNKDEEEKKLKVSRKMNDNSKVNGISWGMIAFYLILMLIILVFLFFIAVKANIIKIAINFKKLGFFKIVQKEEFVQIKDDLLSINKSN